MKKVLIAGFAAAAAAMSPAFAADVPARPAYKAPVVAPLFNWTGFYLGGQVGYAWIHNRQDLSSPTFAIDISDRLSGIVWGAHAGLNWQTGQMVWGIEADLEAARISDTFLVGPPFSATTTATLRKGPQGSLRGRLGYAMNNMLLYATGGVAVGQFRNSYFTSAVFNESDRTTRVGWTLGAGLEYAFSRNWTARAEYRYTDYGRTRINLTTWLAPPGTNNDRITEHTLRLGVSYLWH